MDSKIVTLGSISDEALHQLAHEFRPYTVGIARMVDTSRDSESVKLEPGSFTALGTGVFVTRGSRFGILTAYHCLHSCLPEVTLGSSGTDTLILALNRDFVSLKPSDCFEHVLAKPKSEEYGPDLSFIEIFGDKRASILGKVSSWPLTLEKAALARTLLAPTTLTCLVGFPEVWADTSKSQKSVSREAKHMTFFAAIESGNVFSCGGWDYLDTSCVYEGKELPQSFGGVSGGPVWGIRCRIDKSTGTLTVTESALIGVIFYEGPLIDSRRKVRAHSVESIYEAGWINLPS